MTLDSTPPWLTSARPAWYEEVHAWLAEAARAADLGAVEQVTTVKERPWSVVLRVTFVGTTAYFKACGAGGRHEPGLLLDLQQEWSRWLPGVLAVDGARGWILLADAGLPLREACDAPGQLAALSRLLPAYAELQSATTRSSERLLRLGVPDRRLDRLPGLLEELLADEVLAVGRSAAAAAELRAAARRLLPALERCCADLAAAPYSAALDHGDLHPGNVLVENGECRLCDWGDSSVTHPFVSLGVTLEIALSPLPAAARAEGARQLRDAYLEPWARYESPASLKSDFRRALGVAHVVRALDFARMFAGGDAAYRARWQPLVAEPLARWVRQTS